MGDPQNRMKTSLDSELRGKSNAEVDANRDAVVSLARCGNTYIKWCTLANIISQAINEHNVYAQNEMGKAKHHSQIFSGRFIAICPSLNNYFKEGEIHICYGMGDVKYRYLTIIHKQWKDVWQRDYLMSVKGTKLNSPPLWSSPAPPGCRENFPTESPQ